MVVKYTFGHIEIGHRARSLIEESFQRNWVSAGEYTKKFEEIFSSTFSYRYAVAVSSGTSACFAALAALHEYGATWGDEVIVPALSFVATANAVLAAGFKPVFVDIRRETLNMDPQKIEAAITPKTRAILVVHTMGKPCDMDSICQIKDKHGLILLEDCCEAHGAKYKGNFVGNFGFAGMFSFYAAHLVCSGEGGMIVTQDDQFVKFLRSIRSHGRPDGSDYFQFDRFGLNCKMNDLEAALGIEGMENFQAIFDRRKKNLAYLLKQNQDLRHLLYLLEEAPHEVISPHAFPLVIREDIPIDQHHISSYLQEAGVQVKTLFGSLPTQHRAFKFLGYREGDFPESEYVGKKGLHFGCHQYLNQKELDYVSEHLHTYFRKYL